MRKKPDKSGRDKNFNDINYFLTGQSNTLLYGVPIEHDSNVFCLGKSSLVGANLHPT